LAWIAKSRLPKAGGPEAFIDFPVFKKLIMTVSRFTPIDRDWLRAQSLDVLQSIFENLSRIIGSFLASVPGLALNNFVVILSIYFFLIDGPRFLRFLSTLSPLDPNRSQDMFMTFQNSCRGVVLGLFASAVAQGACIFIFFLLTGIPNAHLFGLGGVLMGMVPVVGTAPITIGAVIYLFGIGEPGRAIFMIFGSAFVGVADNVIRSAIMKGQSEMHPLLALVSVFGATNLMGPPGIFLGPIVAAIFVSFLRILSLELRREGAGIG
jgi:predicted PurR-regulated permease PerM